MNLSRRQIVLLMTDSTRQDMVGCYGNPDMHTPNLDSLAERGIRYQNAYTCQPVCGPARSALFTGIYPHSNGSFTNCVPLGANVKTIGQRLADAGLRTAYIGKWHLDGGDYFGLGTCPEGWDPDYWYDMRCYLEELTEEERLASRDSATSAKGISADFTFGHRCVNQALDFLHRHGTEDFFLTVSLDEPHDPGLCPEPYASMFADYEFPKAPNVWDTLEGKPQYQKCWAGKNRETDRDAVKIKAPRFLGCNAFADAELGRVLDCVRACAPEAMVIYTSDHGDGLESHCLHSKGPVMYNEIARIPLLIAGPGVPQGVVDGHPVSHINLPAMILEYMGLPIPRCFEGKSLLQEVYDPEIRTNDYVITEFTRYEIDHDGFGGLQMMRAIYDGRYKLAVHLLDPVDEFYDMDADPWEMKNLIGDEAYDREKVRLHKLLLEWMNTTRDPFRGYQWELRPWRKDVEAPTWSYTGYTRQRENEEYEPRQLDYATGLPMEEAVRRK